MIHADGFCERSLWDPEKCEEVIVKVPNNPASYGPRSGRMAAEDRLGDIRKEKRKLVAEAQERYFRSLPSELRKIILNRVAEWELNFSPENLFTTDALAELTAEEEQLRNMLSGSNHSYGYEDHTLPPFPFPALDGLGYTRLVELDLDATIDKTVT